MVKFLVSALVWLLDQACELEHGLMCEYLFAQFALKRSADEGLSDQQLARVAAWEVVIVEVTKQEMLHLALATNLLTAIGAAHTHRPNFPHGMARASRPPSPVARASRDEALFGGELGRVDLVYQAAFLSAQLVGISHGRPLHHAVGGPRRRSCLAVPQGPEPLRVPS
jgi:hypothetical protein